MEIPTRPKLSSRSLWVAVVVLVALAAATLAGAQNDNASEQAKQRFQRAIDRIHQLPAGTHDGVPWSRRMLQVLAEESTPEERAEVAELLAEQHGLSVRKRGRLRRISRDPAAFVADFQDVLQPSGRSTPRNRGRAVQSVTASCRADWGCAWLHDPLGQCTEVGWDFWPAAWTCAWAGWITWSPSGLVFHDHCRNTYCQR